MTAPQYPTSASTTTTAPPLAAPYYGAPFMEAVKRFFKKYATFSGRASRSEYWWWVLASVIITLVLEIPIWTGMVTTTDANGVTSTAPGPLAVIGFILIGVWSLAIIVPTLALTVRRLHDVNLSGWMILLGLVPFVGGIIVLIMTLLGPNPQGQRFDRPTGSAYGA
ncbi:DUF805 domain-containing protein [Sinomonas susongensis]|uniref:DUF805 domain-containing protein n=1 Tax=Sinomonas susongensis TaxID=1324851 RepID=UPI001108CC4C|nr:DUF805 domain-containing protein [Sinomonas susongensis]